MHTSIHWSSIHYIAAVLLLISAGSATAQTAGQSINTIPQQVNQSAQTKAVTKSNTVTNNAMNKLDSASNKAFNGFTGLFKKKNKKPKSDSAVTHPADTSVLHPKSTSRSNIRPSPYFRTPGQNRPANRWIGCLVCYTRRLTPKPPVPLSLSNLA
jgi:hypothetical protein